MVLIHVRTDAFGCLFADRFGHAWEENLQKVVLVGWLIKRGDQVNYVAFLSDYQVLVQKGNEQGRTRWTTGTVFRNRYCSTPDRYSKSIGTSVYPPDGIN